jgi:hypothetical protein
MKTFVTPKSNEITMDSSNYIEKSEMVIQYLQSVHLRDNSLFLT